MQAFLIKSHGRTPQLWQFHGYIIELMHSVIIQINEAVSTFYQKWLDNFTKQKLFIYLTIGLCDNWRNMWDIDLAKLLHLTDPECAIMNMERLSSN